MRGESFHLLEPADAGNIRSLLLEELTWPEVQAALEAGWDTVIVPCGAVEQHGPHLGMGSDTVQGRAYALRVAERLGRTLVAPIIPVGCSDHHLGFPGTISLRAETLEAVYVDYCRSLARHGFKRIACTSGHGGNFGPLRDMLPRLREAAAPAQVAAYTDTRAYVEAWAAAARAAGAPPITIGGHSDRVETSLLLALQPSLVREWRAEAGYAGDPFEVFPRVLREGLRAVSPNGILGDARGADRELGQRFVDATVDLLASYFASDAAWD